MKTLGLNILWDLYVDENGNLAIKNGNDRLAQDVASSVRVFKGEIGFNTPRGVEYNKPDLNKETLNYQMNKQARMVEGVDDSIVIFNQLENRVLKPVIYVTNIDGEQIVIGE